MHFIDQDEIEADLPAGWNEKVQASWEYVRNKINQAEQAIRDQSEEKGWTPEQLEDEVYKAKIKARKAAIESKSIWSDLREILSEQSKGKCWYCETNEVRSDNPVDHFRPKNSVSECTDHPGYWWLAFDWTNYRFSCTFCNSRRVEVKTSGGKQDHFPLFVPPYWNKCEDDKNNERPMLLDPAEESDCRLITFNDNGEARPAASERSSEEFKKAEKSIVLYHLNHKPTTRARKIVFQKIRELISNTNELLEQGLDENSRSIKFNRKELIKLIRYECKSTRFNSAARVCLMKFKDDNAWVKDILERA
ncbi:hypothetical protein CLH62_06330 [Marinobacter guineae]|uniref:TIGR02646 family protein n=1 Tax=Marinobacter guineae TaxID=432303 RepID=A0A2G1VK82_9GAMM|nr:hypothetical protein [Marinobacter guineae]PHQ27187.1 hypothetical protein CLH62_06330 [Marinobacter guineae]